MGPASPLKSSSNGFIWILAFLFKLMHTVRVACMEVGYVKLINLTLLWIAWKLRGHTTCWTMSTHTYTWYAHPHIISLWRKPPITWAVMSFKMEDCCQHKVYGRVLPYCLTMWLCFSSISYGVRMRGHWPACTSRLFFV